MASSISLFMLSALPVTKNSSLILLTLRRRGPSKKLSSLHGASERAHRAALIPLDVKQELASHGVASVVWRSFPGADVVVEADPSVVAQWECVADRQIEGGERTGEVRPAPGENPGAERRAGVETPQDEQEEIVGEGAYPVFTAGRERPAPERDSTRPAPALASRHERATYQPPAIGAGAGRDLPR